MSDNNTSKMVKNVTLRNVGRHEADMVKLGAINDESFPIEERDDLSVFFRTYEDMAFKVINIESEGELKGFMVVTELPFNSSASIVVLMNFAVSQKCRGLGIGGKALELLKSHYEGKPILLYFESPDDPDADNFKQRLARQQFYENHGFVKTGYTVRAYGLDFELATTSLDWDEVELRKFFAILSSTIPFMKAELSSK